MAKISVCSWSLHREIPAVWQKDVPSKFSLVDFPRLCVEEFGVDAVELWQMHFLSADQDYVEKVKDALDRSGVRVVNIPVDSGYAAEPDPERRRVGFEVIRRWFHIAEYLGSPFIRVNTGVGEGEEDLQRAIDGYKELVKTAEETGVDLLIENHGGISASSDNIVKIIEGVGSEHFRACPDFGNFPAEVRYEELQKVAEYAAIVHVKTHGLDERGEPTPVDVGRCVDLFEKQGFDGYYSVEFSGKGKQVEGVKRAVAELRRYL